MKVCTFHLVLSKQSSAFFFNYYFHILEIIFSGLIKSRRVCFCNYVEFLSGLYLDSTVNSDKKQVRERDGVGLENN